MAKRLSTGFTNEIGDVYVIDIYDDGFSGSSTDCQVDGSGFTQQFTGEYTNYTGGNIMTTTTTVNLIANISAVTDFISVITSRTESDLRMAITRNGSFWWAGLILPDVVELDDIPAGALPIFQIRAVDGLARLKTIDYNNAGTAYTGKETAIEHVLNCLNKIGTESLWTTNTFVTAYSRWLADGHASGDNPSVLERTRVSHLNFLKVDQTGKVTFRSCYDVLKEFCKTWNCDLFLSDGRFWFISPSEYANTLYGFAARHNFQKDGTVAYVVGGANYALLGRKSQTGSTFSTYNLFRFGRGKYSYYTALKETRVRYKHFSTRNLTAGIQGLGDGSFAATTIFDIDSVGGTARLLFRANLNYRVDWTFPDAAEATHAKFNLQIKIGDYYLSRPVTLTNTLYIIESEPFWTLTVSDYEIIVPIFQNATNYTRVISFTTPPIPEDGDLILYFILLSISDNAGNNIISAVADPTTSLTNIFSEFLLDGTIEGQYNISEFLATNDAAGNSDEAVIETLMGEGPTGSTFGAVDIYDGADWIPSADGWRYGGGGTYIPMSQLLAQEIMYRHKNPAERLSGDFQGKYDLWKGILYTVSSVTKMYGLIGGSFTAGNAIWSLELVVLFRSASGVTVPTQENQTEVGSDTDAPPEIQPGGGVVPSLSGVVQTPLNDAGAAIESGMASGFSNGLVPMRTELLYQEGDAMNTIDTPALGASFSYLDGDELLVVDVNTGQSQEFEADGDSLEGESNIDVVNDVADYRFNPNAMVFHSPRFLLELLGFIRRYRQEIHLVDYDSDIVTLNPLPGFWRAEVTNNIDAQKSFFLYNRRIQNIYVKIGQNVSNSPSVIYNFDIRRNGTILKTVGFTGQNKAVFTDLNGIEENIPADALYTFSVTRTDVSGLAASKGLMVCFVIV